MRAAHATALTKPKRPLGVDIRTRSFPPTASASFRRRHCRTASARSCSLALLSSRLRIRAGSNSFGLAVAIGGFNSRFGFSVFRNRQKNCCRPSACRFRSFFLSFQKRNSLVQVAVAVAVAVDVFLAVYSFFGQENTIVKTTKFHDGGKRTISASQRR